MTVDPSISLFVHSFQSITSLMLHLLHLLITLSLSIHPFSCLSTSVFLSNDFILSPIHHAINLWSISWSLHLSSFLNPSITLLSSYLFIPSAVHLSVSPSPRLCLSIPPFCLFASPSLSLHSFTFLFHLSTSALIAEVTTSPHHARSFHSFHLSILIHHQFTVPPVHSSIFKSLLLH